MRRQTRQRHDGFGLVETLVALAIAGIVLGLALPSLGGLVGGNRAEAIAGDFVRALQGARSEAIKRSRPVVLCRSADPFAAEPACGSAAYRTGWIVYVDENGGPTLDAGDEVILRGGAAGADVSHGPSENVASRVRFDGTGAHVLDSGAPSRATFAIGVGDAPARAVEIAASGRVRLSVAGS